MKIFTWHIHGSYLYFLSQGDYEIYIPVSEQKEEGYCGRGKTFPFGDNVIEVPVSEARHLSFDCILFQTQKNYTLDQYEILSHEQRLLPKIYLEHDTPRQHAVNSRHFMQNISIPLVHVTHFNRLMWDNGDVQTRVIDHGVIKSSARYIGRLEKGIVVINNLPSRGRLLGFDLFMEIREQIPLDLVGMGTEGIGMGEVLHPQLPEFVSQYRFFFNPIRWTSLGLAVCEAMMAGIPVVGLATTELASVITNGKSGYIHTDINYLVDKMKLLLSDHEHAQTIGAAGAEVAASRFNISRFTNEWRELFREVIEQHHPERSLVY